MKLFKRKDESVKSWCINRELREGNHNKENVIVDAVDSFTGEYIAWILSIDEDGIVRVNADAESALKALGYNPSEHNIKWNKYGILVERR